MDGSKIQEPPFALPFETIIHGRYLIQDVIGVGGFGITYRGIDLKENKLIAVKEYYPNGIATRIPGMLDVNVHSSKDIFRKGMDKFLQEARIIYHYNNPYILTIYSLFEENYTAYYVMEYLTGSDLKHILARRGDKLSWQQLKGIILPIMDALVLIHQDGVIHRDISPDNIYVCEDGSPRLIDFGTARVFSENQEMTVIIKKGFSPPEQYSSTGKQGPWTDIYAMAATMYRCLTGIMPPESVDRLRNDAIVPPENVGSDAPINVNRAIMKGLSLSEFQRFATIYDFRNELESVGDVGLTAVADMFTGFADRFRSRAISIRGGVKRIVCESGIYSGQVIVIESDLVFGRDSSCNVIFPKSSAGVSRVHCQIILVNNRKEAVILDCGSSYGTFLNGVRLNSGVPQKLENGSIISFGQNNSFRYETL
ncbi:FHA domain-containing serine/threonine-protein kinase [Butyrivibrio sp. WCD2001]|uniref:FHA domain-containing serine/threonine-protein kinase n=1 Tax=Butyrivibrio sp. WCD2001 TaxID=1280681 RepID=UPI000411F1B6|nr:FHA domain-containing serine/threonine-protein kinase [Butyrivibrio sp. WCD2001]